MEEKVLRLNKAGQPLEWLNAEEAACVYAKNQVIWSLGDEYLTLHGGHSRLTGEQTTMAIASIIATAGHVHQKHNLVPELCNQLLFQRDGMLCLYCGKPFSRQQLTRDHVIPRAQNGQDIWENCVSACVSCNHFKGCRTPEQAGMKLLAIPFRPNKAEYLFLANRKIRCDQMAFLETQFSGRMQQ